MCKDERAARKDWPMPQHGDPVWVTVSEYDLSYLKRVMEKAGSLRATQLLHWAMDCIVGRGVSHDYETVALNHISAALQTIQARNLNGVSLDREPQYELVGSAIAPVSLRSLLHGNVTEDEIGFTPRELKALVQMQAGETITVGGGASATQDIKRLV